MNTSRTPVWRWLPGVVVIPLGIGLWFFSMAMAFDGGGSWTNTGMTLGVTLVPVGLVVKALVMIWNRKGTPAPFWFWADAGVAVVLGLLFLAMVMG